MSNLKTKRIQLGDHATASNNFVIRQPDTPNGSLKIGYGSVDSSTDLIDVFSSDGGVLRTNLLQVRNAGAPSGWENTTTPTLASDASGQFSIANGGNKRLGITSAGIVTTPQQSGFRAYINTSYTHPSGNANLSSLLGALGYWSKSFDNQNDFSTSTGLFTAPVTGMYSFSAGLNAGSSGNNITYFSCEFLVNGSRKSIHWFGNIKGGSSGYSAANNASVFKLSAGDTVGLHCELNSSETLLGNPSDAYSFFSGHLVG